MSTNRSAGRRLRLESLEGREVPAAIAGSDPTNPVDPTVPAQTGTDTSSADPVVVINTGATNPDPGTVTTTSAADGNPQAPAVDLALATTIDRPKPSLGDIVTLKVTVTNNGSVQATGVAATVTLPAGMTFVSSDAGANKFDPTTGTWTPGTVATAGKVTLTLKAKVTDAAAGSVTAAISHADQSDNLADNNTTTTPVAPVLAKLNLMKSVSAASAAVGSTVVMAVAVGNGGPGRARDVVVTDTLGSGLIFVKALSATQGSYNPTTHTWTVGTVAPGTIAVLRVLVTVGRVGRIDSPATVSGTGFDTTTSKLDATAAITGVKASNLSSWSYFAGPGFLLGPMPVPAAVQGTMAMTYPTASLLSAQFLLSKGFSLNGTKLA
jgi:uncharacterized repeat protein (TIGR01451 family)